MVGGMDSGIANATIPPIRVAHSVTECPRMGWTHRPIFPQVSTTSVNNKGPLSRPFEGVVRCRGPTPAVRITGFGTDPHTTLGAQLLQCAGRIGISSQAPVSVTVPRRTAFADFPSYVTSAVARLMYASETPQREAIRPCDTG